MAILSSPKMEKFKRNGLSGKILNRSPTIKEADEAEGVFDFDASALKGRYNRG